MDTAFDQSEITSFIGAARRVLCVGASGTGKSTLVSNLADTFRARGRDVWVLSADPGRPSFGPPGAVSLARRTDEWEIKAIEGVGSLDALRFRLPLLMAVDRLCARTSDGDLLIVDAPGVARGYQAEEFLVGLAQVVRAEVAVALTPDEEPTFLASLGRAAERVLTVVASGEARTPTANQRAMERTAAWSEFLQAGRGLGFGSELQDVEAHPDLVVLDAQPPAEDTQDAWEGRQVVLLGDDGHTAGLGEIVDFRGVHWVIRGRTWAKWTGLLLRDAGRSDRDRVRTRTRPRQNAGGERGQPPVFTLRERPEIPIELGRGIDLRGASVRSHVIGGLFGDPMVLMRLDHRRRCLLFDLGEVSRLPTRIVHETTDVFVTHAHLDHMRDAPWLLRKRLGCESPCRIYGPRGFARRFESVVESFEWDRVGDRGPKFEIRELDGDVLRRFRIQVGKGGVEPIDVADCGDGIVLDEPRFLVSAVELDHAGLPVLAYALRESSHFDVRADLLREHGWKPGRWLGTLKKHAAAREASELIELPDGTSRTVGELADLLLIETEGQKIVYATDFGDTPGNREAVVQLARGAQILVCEASFVQEDVEQAERTGHLTARACGEIAAAAGVERLVPFHFSSRYDQCPERVYAEILEVFEHTLVPSSLWKALE